MSMARANLNMLASQRYWVTWKADGTRYMLFLCKWGVYTIDRAFRVRRTQMRFINPSSSRRYGLGHVILKLCVAATCRPHAVG